MMEKAFDKISHLLMLKVIEISGIGGKYIIIIKATCSKPIANIKFNRERLKTIPLKSGT